MQIEEEKFSFLKEESKQPPPFEQTINKDIQMRLSQAFPPNTPNNKEFTAESHYLISQIDISKVRAQDIIYRQVKYKKDMTQIEELHKEWFPINYSKEYYDQVFKNSDYTIVAEVKVTLPSGRKENVIVGSMFYKIKQQKSSYMKYGIGEWKQTLGYLLGLNEYYAVYIMTLGVMNEFRGKGIAEKMLEQLKQWVSERERIKYIYLDMVTYNDAAAKFYEKNNFLNFKTRPNHYEIENKKYGAYTYIYYVDKQKQQQIKDKLFNKKQPLFISGLLLPVNCIRYCFGKLNIFGNIIGKGKLKNSQT